MSLPVFLTLPSSISLHNLTVPSAQHVNNNSRREFLDISSDCFEADGLHWIIEIGRGWRSSAMTCLDFPSPWATKTHLLKSLIAEDEPSRYTLLRDAVAKAPPMDQVAESRAWGSSGLNFQAISQKQPFLLHKTTSMPPEIIPSPEPVHLMASTLVDCTSIAVF